MAVLLNFINGRAQSPIHPGHVPLSVSLKRPQQRRVRPRAEPTAVIKISSFSVVSQIQYVVECIAEDEHFFLRHWTLKALLSTSSKQDRQAKSPAYAYRVLSAASLAPDCLGSVNMAFQKALRKCTHITKTWVFVFFSETLLCVSRID